MIITENFSYRAFMLKSRLIYLLFCFLIIISYAYASDNDSTSKFIGFSQVRAIKKAISNSRNFDFEVTKLRFGFQGSSKKKVNYLFLLEGGSASPDDSKAFSLLDAWIGFQLCKYAEIHIGQDWYKIGWEYSQPIPKLPFINFSESIAEIFDTMGRNGFYGYDIGVWINAYFRNLKHPFGFNIGITNGTGLNRKEDNSLKDYCLRVYADPNEYMHIGVSYFNGYSYINSQNIGEFIIDIESIFNYKKLMIGTEYVYANYNKFNFNDISFNEIKKRGFFIFTNYDIIKYLKLLTKYEWNKGIYLPNIEKQLYYFGITYSFFNLNNIKINYIYEVDDNINRNNKILFIQLQVIFN